MDFSFFQLQQQGPLEAIKTTIKKARLFREKESPNSKYLMSSGSKRKRGFVEGALLSIVRCRGEPIWPSSSRKQQQQHREREMKGKQAKNESSSRIILISREQLSLIYKHSLYFYFWRPSGKQQNVGISMQRQIKLMCTNQIP